MKMSPATRKIRINKKTRLHIRRSQQYVRELRLSGTEIDIKVANLIDESIGLNLLQYNSPGFTDGQKKARKRLDEIQKEIEVLAEQRIDGLDSTKFNVTT